VNLLLDTNVLSEVQRPAPDLKVLGWLDAVDEDRVFISVASIAELRRGIALMDNGRRRAALAAWLANDLPARFAERILPIDHAVAEHWGDLMARSRRSGVALSVMGGDRARQRPHAGHAQRQGFRIVRRAAARPVGGISGPSKFPPNGRGRWYPMDDRSR
jgi:predicted nucleic acid-binding protein